MRRAEVNVFMMRIAGLSLRRAAPMLLAFTTLLPPGMQAQDRQRTEMSRRMEDLDRLTEDRSAASLLQSPSGVALESPVDPSKYFVGPSDVISVNVWTSPPLSYPLTVTPEGTLIVPTVGEIMVSDLSLAAAKEKILGEIRRKYLNVGVTATLVKPRPIVVSVVGAVLNTGLYTVNAIDRANRAISEADKPARMQSPEDVQPVLESMSMRNILVKHRDGSENRVDLLKYFATKDDRWNPYLREGDIVVVTKKDPVKDKFAIYGQVNSVGRYELVPGDSLLDAIQIANGFTPQALTDRVIFSRMNDEGTALENRTVNIQAIMAGREPNIALQPGDRVIVNARVDLRQDYNVDVRGEVLYPGTYPITKNHTRLSEIIREAGGFTGYATLSSAIVTRQAYQREDAENERMLSLRGEINNDDSTGYSLATNLRIRREEVNVDFVRLFTERDSTQDIILEAEDQVIIPSRRHTVYVFGQVASPGHVPFIEGRDVSYYIGKAGGYIERANEGSVKVVKSKTKQWLSPGDTRIEEGDNIWVPAEPNRPFSYYTTVASQMASVLSIVLGVAIIVVQATK